MEIRLLQESGAEAGRVWRFDAGRVRLGRAPDNELALDPQHDLDASSRHCELVCLDQSWVVKDLGSRNGTFVNGARVQQRTLAAGDVLLLGGAGPRFRVELPAPGARPFAPVKPPAGWTVAMEQVPVAPARAAEASIGQAVAAALPAGAQVGRSTVAMMIDQAIVASDKRRSNTGLKLAIVLLSGLVIVSIALGAFLLLERSRGRESEVALPVPPGGDPSSAGSRLAAANESAIYMLAYQRPGAARTQGFCTGFAVTRDIIATNAHCVQVANDEIARGSQIVALRNKAAGSVLVARPVYMDARFHDSRYSRGGTGYDVGLVRVTGTLPTVARLASDRDLFALHEGDAVFVYGFPGMTMNENSPVATITLGLINRVTNFQDGIAEPAAAQKLQHSAQTSGGSSGSPIFLPSGSVVGINAGSLADEERQIVIDPSNGQRREVEVNRGSNFKYGMRADLIRQGLAAVGVTAP
ncbi:MAG: putative protease [Myxococcaceae bacterium]|nr:putative protease [Myxococcaceae bacterium]